MSKFISKNIKLLHSERMIKFPYKVNNFGYINNAQESKKDKNNFPNFIEITVRLRSSETMAHQRIGTREYKNSFPHVIVKIPGESYHYINIPERDVIYFAYAEKDYDLLKKLGLFDGKLCWDIDLTTEVNFLLERFYSFMNISQDIGVADRVDLTCFELLSELILQRAMNKDKVEDDNLALMRKIDSYLRYHIDENIDINILAEEFNISRSTFFRHWETYHDISPAKYFLNLRLEEAARRLIRTNSSILEIANSLGFTDCSYFCRLFRQQFGVTPAVYKNTNQI